MNKKEKVLKHLIEHYGLTINYHRDSRLNRKRNVLYVEIPYNQKTKAMSSIYACDLIKSCELHHGDMYWLHLK